MNTYTIVLERIGTGEHALSMVTRQENEMAARAYAEAAIAQSPDLRVVAVYARPYDASPRLLRAAWLGGRRPGTNQRIFGPIDHGQ